MLDLPLPLLERLRQRQAVLVTGIGCSELAGVPGWVALTEWLAGRLVFSDARDTIARLVAGGRLTDAAALIRDLLPHAALEEALGEAFPPGAPVPDTMTTLARFPWRAIVTTAFGDLWPRALAEGAPAETNGSDGVLVGTDDAAKIRAHEGNSRTPLLHLFGRVADPTSLCLGPADARTRLAAGGGLSWLEDLSRRRSLILVGFRPTDPDFGWLGGWLAARSGNGAAPQHFVFLDLSAEADPDTEAALVALRTGLHVIPCLAGTAEAMERLAGVATETSVALTPSDADIDVEHWFRRWVETPSDPEPRQMLARAETALRADERWDRVIEILLQRLELEDERDQQIAALNEVARIFGEVLGAPERALAAEIAALRVLPDDDELWHKLRAHAAAAGAWEQLCTEGANAARAAEAAPGVARIWRELARVARDELGRPEQALDLFEVALRAEPGDQATRDQQLALLRAHGSPEELVAGFRAAAAEAHDPSRAAALTLEAAEQLERRLGDRAGAIATYEAALTMTPDESVGAIAADALERLYEHDRRWGDLAALLERRAGRAGRADALTIRRRRAEILTEHLDALDVAADDLEALLEAAPPDEDPHETRATLAMLLRIYERAERHEDFLRVLRRQADLATGHSERLALLRKLAAEAEARPDALERAAEALDEILKLEPRDPDAFPALSWVYKTLGRPEALIEAQTRRLEVTETADARRDILLEMAETYRSELDEPEKALDAYLALEKTGDLRPDVHAATAELAERLGRWDLSAEATRRWVESAPEDAKALAALARVRRHLGDRDTAAAMFISAAERHPEPRAAAELWADAATMVQDELKDEDRALGLYERALAADPAHLRAAQRLCELHAARGDTAAVERLLEAQIDALEASPAEPAHGGDNDGNGGGAPDGDRLVPVLTRLAALAAERGTPDGETKALAALAKAHALRPEALAVLRPFADLRAKREEWQDAQPLYQAILRHHRAALAPADVLHATMQLARAETELGQLDEAVAAYRAAKDIAPDSRPVLEALCALHASRVDWTAWAATQRELASLTPPPERARLREELGDAYVDKLGDTGKAEEAYRAALDSEPDDARHTSILRKLADIYVREVRWPQAADTLAELARTEATPAARAKALFNSAVIWRDRLQSPTQAAQLFERCLDDAPEMNEAFEALDALHTAAHDWRGLAGSLGRMIKRLPADANANPRRLALWTRLGDLATEQLSDPKLAMSALEAATALDPRDVPHQEKLARLYEAAGVDGRDQAIAAHQKLLARDPTRLDSLRALARLYGEVGALDKQWCVAAALAFANRADLASDAIYRRHRPPHVVIAPRPFTDEVWQRTRHPEEDAQLDALFALTAPYLAAATSDTPGKLGLRRRQHVELGMDQEPASLAVIQMAQALGLPRPEVYRLEEETSHSTILNTQYKGRFLPTLALAPSTQRRRSFDLVFELASQLALLRPERFLKWSGRTPVAVDVGLRASLALAGSPGHPVVAAGEAASLAQHLARAVPPGILPRIAEAGRALLTARPEVDVTAWLAAVELTAGRVALLLCGDLGAAARVINTEPAPITIVAPPQRLGDLVSFSVSEDYFACRQLLGLAIA
jgi:tetratricopeptide (TPR) repeat protein